ncbi:alpha/beta hydrolase [Antribacter sp. KLBMP9083]|uniref:Alpha/beta hydrolase n=1 Tax=Antribacter soli TaxID=2910976 RepID=A0AA41U9B7_9MICO|nr:alpha/beta hydrolase [Antribacter soli]MCF4123360.1 alpha/beta hydrolase [Antribacter soli]
MAQDTTAPAKSAAPVRRRRGRLLRWTGWFGAGVLALVLALLVAFQVSYWPTTLLLRYSPKLNGTATLQALEKHVPEGVDGLVDEQYRDGDPDGRLDVFWPEDAAGPLPVVVWVHGGAFVAGTKDGTSAYLKILAAHGYTTVSVEYTKAPEAHYPYQVEQMAAALEHVVANADRFHADIARIVLAGDSAGAHLAAQTALAIADDGYAAAAGLPQPLDPAQVRGVVLACGAYDLTIPDYSDGLVGRLVRDILWAYTGEKDFDTDPRLAYASIPQHVTSSLPPMFITAGNGDPLEPHSRALATALQQQGVTTDTLFFPADREPVVPHEYQFDLDDEPGQEALQRILAFLATTTTPS